MKRLLPWDEVEEVTFECEPGTLTEGKLKIIRDMGVTRLSLGIENFDDHILQINGRAHGSKEIVRAYDFARSIGFPQVNIDLIAGMLGETEEQLARVRPQDHRDESGQRHHLPDGNSVQYHHLQGNEGAGPVGGSGGGLETKRAWVDYAFRELERPATASAAPTPP